MQIFLLTDQTVNGNKKSNYNYNYNNYAAKTYNQPKFKAKRF